MKRTKTKPAGVTIIFGTTFSIPEPIKGKCAFFKPKEGVMLFRYDPGAVRIADLIHPLNPEPIIYTGDCGDYEEVLRKAGPGCFATIEPPWFNIGKLTVEAAYKQIANMCKALDEIGVYWRIMFADSQFAMDHFSGHSITIWQTPNISRLIITNYVLSDTPVEHRSVPNLKHFAFV